jgi:hypothetical protein
MSARRPPEPVAKDGAVVTATWLGGAASTPSHVTMTVARSRREGEGADQVSDLACVSPEVTVNRLHFHGVATWIADLRGGLRLEVVGPHGCGGDDSEGDAGPDETSDAPSPDSEEPTELDVCGLLSAADLKAALSSPFDDGDPTHQEETGADQCVWSNTDAPPVKVFSVTVLREGHLSEAFEEGGVTVASLHEDTKAAMSDVEELDLGDDSYLSGTTLVVLDGDAEYTFTTVFGDSSEAIAGLKRLAKRVVGG